MVPKVPLYLHLFSLAYLAVVLVLHFRDNHYARTAQHELQRAHDALSSTRNQSRQAEDDHEKSRRQETRSRSIARTTDAPSRHQQKPDPIPFDTRAHWIRQANAALWQHSSPCPRVAFASVVVNHTDAGGLGELICMGVSSMTSHDHPTLHGEIAAINNCTSILTSTLSRGETRDAFKSFSLYSNAEPCPICASAVREAGFKECVYGSSLDTLTAKGWDQIQEEPNEQFEPSTTNRTETRIIGEILQDETDPYFSWQFDESYACPIGCTREYSGTCEPIWSNFEK